MTRHFEGARRGACTRARTFLAVVRGAEPSSEAEDRWHFKRSFLDGGELKLGTFLKSLAEDFRDCARLGACLEVRWWSFIYALLVPLDPLVLPDESKRAPQSPARAMGPARAACVPCRAARSLSGG